MVILSCTPNKDLLLKINHISFISFTKVMTVKTLWAFLLFIPATTTPSMDDRFGFIV